MEMARMNHNDSIKTLMALLMWYLTVEYGLKQRFSHECPHWQTTHIQILTHIHCPKKKKKKILPLTALLYYFIVCKISFQSNSLIFFLLLSVVFITLMIITVWSLLGVSHMGQTFICDCVSVQDNSDPQFERYEKRYDDIDYDSFIGLMGRRSAGETQGN